MPIRSPALLSRAMVKRISQMIMVWLLPLILIGGMIWPLLGYLVFFMMVFFLTLSYFKGRFWCAYLCPRGAFLDLVLCRLSLKKKLPASFTKARVKWMIFFVFIAFFISQLVVAEKNLFSIGFVFVRICLITTLLAIFLGIHFTYRAWCAICPMGTLQAKIASLREK